MASSILITGVSGYIGGSVLSAILDWRSRNRIPLNIGGVVRSKEQGRVIDHLDGAHSILVKDFDELNQLEELAKEFDIIIHAGAGWHTESAKALLRGLSFRRAAGRQVHYIQISGTSNLSDRPHSSNFVETQIFNDHDDIFGYEKTREGKEIYYQRTTDIAVVETGEALRVPTYIIMAPTIFGIGTGPFNKWSVQLPAIIADALKAQHVKVIGNGQTIWTHVHIEDLADFFTILLEKMIGGLSIPSGRQGIYFCESGEHTHLEMAKLLANAGSKLGLFSHVLKVSLQEGADAFAGGNAFRAELSFGANARCKAELARDLGWKPSREYRWEETFTEELEEYVRSRPQPKTLPTVMRKHE